MNVLGLKGEVGDTRAIKCWLFMTTPPCLRQYSNLFLFGCFFRFWGRLITVNLVARQHRALVCMMSVLYNYVQDVHPLHAGEQHSCQVRSNQRKASVISLLLCSHFWLFSLEEHWGVKTPAFTWSRFLFLCSHLYLPFVLRARERRAASASSNAEHDK